LAAWSNVTRSGAAMIVPLAIRRLDHAPQQQGHATTPRKHLGVLRPPTFAQLARVLRQAASRGEPYHVVHFDGHGAWTELPDSDQSPTQSGGGSHGPWDQDRYAPRDRRPGPHGYLLFEQLTAPDNCEYVDGLRLGNLLAETQVPVLVLNACQSAHADLTPTPQDAATAPADVQTRVRAYGSLAQEVVDAGVAGVVAMRYSVYVVTAAQFIADMYASLLEGLPLGEAVSMGRKQLAAQPNREIAFTPRPLQDWVVPVVYEGAPLALFPKPRAGEHLRISIDQVEAGRERAGLVTGLPASPDVGFYGRDETLLALDLALDRAFDSHQVVLLHAFAGAGKTSTAVEFARWYQHTGGIQGPVLFTSFDHHLPLARVLDQLGTTFERPLEQVGVHWLALEEPQRRQVVLQLLAQQEVLWIWDNVELVAGFPEGSPSTWSAEEQAALVAFLQAVQDTKAKVLLTSRRDEHAWLGELPARIELPPMPMVERVQLARGVAQRYRHSLVEVDDWRPLLAYSQGNPLTITVLVGQALRSGIRTQEQVNQFVGQLRTGEARLEDDRQQGRTRSLGASLAYGFEDGFSERERDQLALLHLFQGFIDVAVLCVMGEPRIAQDAAVPALATLSREAGIRLLDRAAEVGLLTRVGDGYYAIHPALPWYFARLFTHQHGRHDSQEGAAPRRAYASAVAALGTAYHYDYQLGHTGVVAMLGAEESNLLHALSLARTNGWWDHVIGSMQGLQVLYQQTGRWVEWARLVARVTPELVDPVTEGPLPGLEEHWSILSGYRVVLAQRARDWTAASRLHQARIAKEREEAKTALAVDPASLDLDQRAQLQNLAIAIEGLGAMLREQQEPDCVPVFTEALELAQRIGDRPREAVLAFHLGDSYLMAGLRNLDQAEFWYRDALARIDPADRLHRAQITGQLGRIYAERFDDALKANLPEDERLSHFHASLEAYYEALKLHPKDAVSDLAVTHRMLGIIYDLASQVDAAMDHHRQSIHYCEVSADRYGAAVGRSNIAITLSRQGRMDEALLWAQAALDDYQSLGLGAKDEIARTERLLAQIDQDRAAGTSKQS
jgi:tetratricopeptide (TPR) repeat protein